MEEILKTTLLEFEKSTYLIDLVKHNSGKQYIRILQTIQDEEINNKRVIKINPSLLSDLLKVLTTYQDLIPGNKEKQQNEQTTSDTATTHVRARTLTESDKTAIQNRYLKGVSITDLTIQFDCKAELIEQVLNNCNIAIIDNKPPKSFYYKKSRLKRK
ncbi:hypothetical protein [Microbacter margulisiae]|uniref:Uncharacterized protein n=1 Tax=Microbacter margulisiae TaxID=1350067 RepID=A0A7W5DPD5_9PORP|nr:hypothetical protein [Microbacter margulisiae]MBB3186625.1 hypothetical protein [Microbacter margulisiae]